MLIGIGQLFKELTEILSMLLAHSMILFFKFLFQIIFFLNVLKEIINEINKENTAYQYIPLIIKIRVNVVINMKYIRLSLLKIFENFLLFKLIPPTLLFKSPYALFF